MTRDRLLIEEAPWLTEEVAAGPLFAHAARSAGTDARSAAGPCLSEEQVGTCSPRDAVFGARRYRPASPDVCQAGGWTVALWDLLTGETTLIPFRCKSWRCTRCAPLVNARDASRIEAALGKRTASELLFLTLTFDRSRMIAAVRAKRPELSAEAAEEYARAWAWRVCRENWKRLRDRLAARYAARFQVPNPKPKGQRRKAWLTARRKARIDYVQTWEQHRSGWPHVHAVLWCPELAREVRRHGSYELVDGSRVQRWKDDVLRDLAVASGFGPIADVQFPRSNEAALAGYLVKLAAELTGSHHKAQTPIEAPRGFRRLRATPKWLERLRTATGRFGGAVLGAPVELVERALAAGAASIEEAGKWARAMLESVPIDGFTERVPCASGPPLLAGNCASP